MKATKGKRNAKKRRFLDDWIVGSLIRLAIAVMIFLGYTLVLMVLDAAQKLN